MDAAKIRLSPLEMQVVNNTEWILTKNGIMQKAKCLMEFLQNDIQNYVNIHPSSLPADVLKFAPKISKGENYKGLPYLVLDYPRCFQKNNVYAIRCMFWWGNFFSTTLHLSGQYKQQFSDKLVRAYHIFFEKEFFLCNGEDEWEHHFENTNYTPLSEMMQDEFKNKIASLSFIKIAKQFPLSAWNNIQNELLENFKLLLKLCKT
ncbi:MAG: hypothetical protein M3O67_07950 [Bacteroidota bacterium]|nr:hypothetical protein [Bacteroidota bacterium]